MAIRAAALAIAVCLIASHQACAQKVGSWRNEPGTGAIVYGKGGHRIFWDDNGQKVGRYNFHTNRFESLESLAPGIGAGLAGVTGEKGPLLSVEGSTPPPAAPPRSQRRAFIYRGGSSALPRR